MNHLSGEKPPKRECDEAGAATSARGLGGRLCSVPQNLYVLCTRPFRRSIRARFQLALFVAFIGIASMGAIATVSSSALLNTFEENVAEATEEMRPSHHLEIMLREAERLAGLYVVQRDAVALAKFQKVASQVDRYFTTLSEHLTTGFLERHDDNIVEIARARDAWKRAKDATLGELPSRRALSEIAAFLIEVNTTISSAYEIISAFHHRAMDEMRDHLLMGQTFARWAHYAVSASIVLGASLLTVLALFVGRSVLRPIGELQEAAARLAKKDLSHRVSLRNTQDELGQLGSAFNTATDALQQLYEELERRSTHDGLTGVLNHAAFGSRLEAECKSADRHKRPLSLLMVDIDFFKLVNDTHGHQTGDIVLRTLAGVLDKATRPGDVVARYGGEEFSVILPETDKNTAFETAERLRKIIEMTAFECAASRDINVTISVGCSTRSPHTLVAEDIVCVADKALYQAKERGRNRVCASSDVPFSDRARSVQRSAA